MSVNETINSITDVIDAGDFYWGIEWRLDGFAVVESWDGQATWICNCELDSREECLEFINGWMTDYVWNTDSTSLH